MAKLKRDERVCPICAETIKAAAIKCRYCQSELTPIEPELGEPELVEPELVEPELVEPELVQPEAAASAELPKAPRRSDPPAPTAVENPQQRLTLILATLVALAAVAVGVLWWNADHDVADADPHGVLVGDEPRNAAVVAAADLTQRALSYDYRHLANDMEVARAHMTPSFEREYKSTMRLVKADTIKNKVVLDADVVAASIIRADEHRAMALVFLNQTTSAGKKQQLTRNALVVTLTRGKGDWNIAKLTALG